MVGGHRVDFSFLDQQHFWIGEWIRHAGLASFCSLSERYYPGLMREFYGSLARGSDGWIAQVRGRDIPISAEILSRVWDIPMTGSVMDSLLDRVSGLRCIFESDTLPEGATIPT